MTVAMTMTMTMTTMTTMTMTMTTTMTMTMMMRTITKTMTKTTMTLTMTMMRTMTLTLMMVGRSGLDRFSGTIGHKAIGRRRSLGLGNGQGPGGAPPRGVPHTCSHPKDMARAQSSWAQGHKVADLPHPPSHMGEPWRGQYGGAGAMRRIPHGTSAWGGLLRSHGARQWPWGVAGVRAVMSERAIA